MNQITFVTTDLIGREKYPHGMSVQVTYTKKLPHLFIQWQIHSHDWCNTHEIRTPTLQIGTSKKKKNGFCTLVSKQMAQH